ncbi:hypothetical protein [Amycolatopsis thermophila]|uniref:Excreted virulence factor EspC, type VII ESX diderm n=1 Tax=Amycolatopsis thermophila TaxID=206084 RepID=A0ABU0ETG2_9PSEU|nr:hypothetical protein [Amycolatopsis thermophila]MDQ0378082.1 hypothetical protein [Amycolatopsis thermophila]
MFEAAGKTLATLVRAIDTAISKYDASDEAATDALSTFKDQESR